jgi:hypothetical protein
MTYCAAPVHAPCFVAVVADRTPLSDSSVASPATHPGACSLRPPVQHHPPSGAASCGQPALHIPRAAAFSASLPGAEAWS